MASEYAKAWEAGRDSVLRKNKSGCCCKFDEEGDEILELCMAHKQYFIDLLDEQRGLK